MYVNLVPIPLCAAVRSADICRWNARRPAERLAGAHFSRAKRLNGDRPNGYWSARQWLALLEAAEYRCHYCHRQFPPDELVPDHATPLARQLPDSVNAIWNIRPCCPLDNARKGAKTEQEYLDWLATHPDRDLALDTDRAAEKAA